jgi:nitroreductase
MKEQNDPYQERYLAHQARKRETLIQIMKERHSNRRFSDREVEQEKIDKLIEVVELAPSSCGRKAVKVKVITDRDQKALLGGLLVGGVGWIHRAPAILLITADPVAYKAGNEIDWMPYLDGGVVAHQLAMMATTLGIHGCICNPNIRDFNKEHYHKVFGDEILTIAFAVGYPMED